MGTSGSEQPRRELQRVGGEDVVVGEPVDQQQRARQLAGEGQQRRSVVDLGLHRRVAEIALRVVRVVEPPLGHRRAGDGRVDAVGSQQHGQGGEVPAEAPAADGDSVEVEASELGGCLLERVDLVLQRGCRQVLVDRPLPLGAAPRGPPAIDDDDGEAVVGEPLRNEVRQVRPQRSESVRSSVRIEQHGQRSAVVIVWQDHRRRQPSGPEEVQRRVERQVRRRRCRRQLDAIERVPERPRLVERGGPDDDGAARGGGRVHAGFVGQRGEPFVVVAPDVRHGGVVDRIGDEDDTTAIGGDDGADLEICRGDRLAVDEQPSGAVTIGAVDELAVGPESRRARRRARPIDRRSRRSAPPSPRCRRRRRGSRSLVANVTGSR